MADYLATILVKMKKDAGKTGVAQQLSITEKDIEKRKEIKEVGYNSIIAYLTEGKNVEGLLLSLEHKIEIPKERAISAANEIAESCYKDPFGTFMDLAGKIGEIEIVSAEKPGAQELALTDKLETAVLTTYRKYGLIAEAESLESRRKMKNCLSIR